MASTKASCFVSSSTRISFSRELVLRCSSWSATRFPSRPYSLFSRAEPTSLLFTLASLSTSLTAVRATSGTSVRMSQPPRVIALDAFARRQFKVRLWMYVCLS